MKFVLKAKLNTQKPNFSRHCYLLNELFSLSTSSHFEINGLIIFHSKDIALNKFIERQNRLNQITKKLYY